MRKLLVLLCLLAAQPAAAQIVIPYTFAANTTIKSSEVNGNFSALASGALNRAGGTMSGTLTTQNIAAGADATYDLGASGVKFRNAYLSGTLTVATITASATITGKDLVLASPTTGVTVNGVNVIGSTGKIPALTTTYFTSLAFDAANLTGTAPVATLGSGSPSASTFLRGDGSWSAITAGKVGYITSTKSTTYTAVTSDEVLLANGTFTVTLYTCVGNTNRALIVKNTGTGTITVDGNASETIDGALTFVTSTQYQSVTLVCDGSNWSII